MAAFNPAAFGPLSAGSRQAAAKLSGGGGTGAGGFNLRRLSGAPSFGEPQEAPAVESPVGLATGMNAPVEEQTPLLPEGEATGDRGDITQLPGFQAATGEGGVAELPSADELTGSAQQQSSEFRNTLQRLSGTATSTGAPSSQPAELPEAWRTDLDSAFKGLKALTGGVKAVDPGVGGGLGGLTSLYGVAQSAASGNPIGIAQNALGAYGGLTSAAGVAPLSSSLVSLSPQIATAIAESAGIATAGMTTAQLTGAVSSALAAWGGAAAPLIQGIVEYIGNAEQMRMRDAGWRNNPIKGALYSNATQGVGTANQILEGLGERGTASTPDLALALLTGTNSLLPYYATAQGGRGAIRASDTVTGKNQGPTSNSQPYTGDGASPEQYTGNFTTASRGIADLVNELMGRGVTYEQLGSIPVSGNWASQTLDAGNRPDQMLQGSPNLARFQQEAPGFFGQRGLNAIGEYGPGGGWTQAYTKPADQQTSELLESVLGTAMTAPADVGKASGNMTSMYGGPLWAALARSGAGGDQGLMRLISEKFDPWVSLREPGAAPTGPSFWEQMQAGGGGAAAPGPMAADPATMGMPTGLGDLQRLIAAARPKAGALAPDLPAEFSEAARNPLALQALLSNPGLLARLFSGAA